MNTFHLIDLENIPVKWVSLIDLNNECNNEILIFKLENPNDKNYILLEDAVNFINYNVNTRIIKCKNGRPKMNALDFQLASYIGYLIAMDSQSEIIVYSNDTGFDPVIEWWKDRGISIKRIENENNGE